MTERGDLDRARAAGRVAERVQRLALTYEEWLLLTVTQHTQEPSMTRLGFRWLRKFAIRAHQATTATRSIGTSNVP